MTLSKQLYIIISFIFFMIFTGNFIISVNNFKEYLQVESTTKSQDTATSLGMSLKSLISDKTDSEIELTIKAIGNSGFYKEIRLEDVEFNFTKQELLKKAKLNSSYKVKEISIDKKDGEILTSQDDLQLEKELEELEGEISSDTNSVPVVYSFIPSKTFPNNKKLTINFTAYNEKKSIASKIDMQIDKVLVKVSREEKFEAVPQWFINTISMKMTETKSEISNGWKTQAIIYVSANAGEAYAKLYEQVKNAIVYAIISFIISIIILFFFLELILKPLKSIDSLAKSISKGDFKIIKNIPWTLELKNVSLSMNDMSNKIKDMINKLNTNLEKITAELSKDDLTGLQQDQTFQTDMKQMFIKKSSGYIFSIKIDNLADFSKDNECEVVNKFIKEFANILEYSDNNDINAYRFYGSFFALIVKKEDIKDIEQITKNLKILFDKLAIKYNIASVAHIGVAPFNKISTTIDILKHANEAYEMAKQIGPNESYIIDKNDLSRD
ncbi:MAG: LapD/MoxY N-terminal periplasmic domain-containing protein, partial [Campylobacterota bacterium]|nr:LapD/MoxY N-terminal periplasmic domain-containing protein [Campylobacterota bacterium]